MQYSNQVMTLRGLPVAGTVALVLAVPWSGSAADPGPGAGGFTGFAGSPGGKKGVEASGDLAVD